MNSLLGIFRNTAIIAAFFGWLTAQILKVPIGYYLDGVFDWKRCAASGGMPSSHSAAVCAAATTIGMLEGFNTSIFAVCAVLSAIVMYDAAGVRRAAGKHAKVLNEIVKIFRENKELTDEKLKEWIGHTPFEVFIGAWLGILVGFVVTTIATSW